MPQNFPSASYSDLKGAIYQPLIVSLDTPLMDAIHLMDQVRLSRNPSTASERDVSLQRQSSCVLVKANAQLLGIFTPQDLVRVVAMKRPLDRLTMAEVMSSPVITLKHTDYQDLSTVLQVFRQHDICHLPIVDEQEQPVGVVTPETLLQTLGQDLKAIYSRARSATDRLESEEFLRFALEATSMGIWEVNLLTGEEYWSAQTEVLHGFVPGTFGRTTEAFRKQIHPNDLDLVNAAHQQALETGNFEAEFRTIQPDGATRWIAATGKVFYDEFHRAVRIVGMDQDVTERKQSKAALQLSESRFRRIIDSSLIGIFFTDSEGLITEANDVFLELVGYTREDLQSGKMRWNAMTPAEHAWVDQRIDEDLAQHQVSATYEKEYIRKDGSLVPVLIGVAILEDSQRQDLEVVFVIDIRDRKRAEAALREQAQQERELNRLKDDFLSTVSHELRTPITNIKMAVQMLETVLNQNQFEDERVAQYLSILQEQCRQEMNLLNNLLDLQSLESQPQPLQLTTLHLQDWIPNVVHSFAARARNQQQAFYTDIPANLPPLISDRASLERILIELLNNACKYTPPGAEIAVMAKANGETLQLCVSNSGVEIPAQELPHIFDKFYRVTSVDRWLHGGTGLGLALVKKLTEHLGGCIRAESGGNLTVFTVELPLPLVRET